MSSLMLAQRAAPAGASLDAADKTSSCLFGLRIDMKRRMGSCEPFFISL